MRSAALYIAAAICLVLIVSMAWWSREFMPIPPNADAVEVTTTYRVQEDDTVAGIAEGFRIDEAALASANEISAAGGITVEPGQVIRIPPPESRLVDSWSVHGLGLLAELIGVLLSFWLAAMVGLLPKGVRNQIFGISSVLAIVSYAASQSVAVDNPMASPQFLFGALKDGFTWSAAFPMLARLLGIKDIEAIQPEDAG